MEPLTPVAEQHVGQPCWRVTLGYGDSVLVAQHGGQVLSWRVQGREQLYLSPQAVFDGRSAIRGGVPVCWPQFNARGPLGKHGFARQMPWTWGGGESSPEENGACFTLTLSDNEDTWAQWPHPFGLQLQVDLRPRSLRLTLRVTNRGADPMAFTAALHTYLAVENLAAASLIGLQDRPEWDALTDHHRAAGPVLRFAGPFDRVYGGVANPVVLQDGARRVRISQSDHWEQTVVWNPGESGCAGLADMPPSGHLNMLCVEAAQVYLPVVLTSRNHWEAWQQFDVF